MVKEWHNVSVWEVGGVVFTLDSVCLFGLVLRFG